MISLFNDETACLGPDIKLIGCSDLLDKNTGYWIVSDLGEIKWSKTQHCLTFVKKEKNQEVLEKE